LGLALGKDVFDAFVALATIIWFLWLLAWPYAVIIAVIASAIAGVRLLKRRKVGSAVACLIVTALLCASAVLVHFELQQFFYNVFPYSLRSLGQFVIILFPLAVWIAGLIWGAVAIATDKRKRGPSLI